MATGLYSGASGLSFGVGLWADVTGLSGGGGLSPPSGGSTWPDGPTLLLDFIGSGVSLDLVFAEDIVDYADGTLALDFLTRSYTSLSPSVSYTTFEPDPVMGGFADIQVWS